MESNQHAEKTRRCSLSKEQFAAKKKLYHFCSQTANSCFAKWNVTSIPHSTRDSIREADELVGPVSTLSDTRPAGKSPNLSLPSVSQERVSRKLICSYSEVCFKGERVWQFPSALITINQDVSFWVKVQFLSVVLCSLSNNMDCDQKQNSDSLPSD